MDQVNDVPEVTLSELLDMIKRQKSGHEREVQFFGHCVQHLDRSYSQFLQDLWVLFETGCMTGGYFVDFGATNGIDCNNTYLLEKEYYWKGIVCEPNPVFSEELKRNRNCYVSNDCVYHTTGQKVKFLQTDEEYLSTIEGCGKDDEHGHKRMTSSIVEVETISLVDLLRKYNAPRTIDYLSIDTEGSELDILNAFFNDGSHNYEIKAISVEQNIIANADSLIEGGAKYEDILTVDSQLIHVLLSAVGYKNVFKNFSKVDGFYIKVV